MALNPEDTYAVVDETGSIGFRKPMTQDELDEIRKRCDASTEGPLFAEYEPHDIHNGGGDTWHVVIENRRGSCLACDVSEADAQFFAHARTDVPRLLDEVELLNRVVEWYKKLAPYQLLEEENERLQREIADLRNRPPMACSTCEDHNQELADKNRELRHENAELRDAISDDAAATLADRNEIRKYMDAILDALVFASDPIDMGAFTLGYKDAAARVEALANEVRRLRSVENDIVRFRESAKSSGLSPGQLMRRFVQIEAIFDTMEQRLALLEPVWEAAKEWQKGAAGTAKGPCCTACDLHAAIDAAVAKEGK